MTARRQRLGGGGGSIGSGDLTGFDLRAMTLNQLVSGSWCQSGKAFARAAGPVDDDVNGMIAIDGKHAA